MHARAQSKQAMMKSVLKGRELHLRMNTIRRTDPSLCVEGLPEAEAWGVQLFRSIDSGACCSAVGRRSAQAARGAARPLLGCGACELWGQGSVVHGGGRGLWCMGRAALTPAV